VKSPKLKGLRSISSLKDKFSGSRSASGSVKQVTPKLETAIDSLGGGLGIDMDFKGSSADRSKDGIEAWASACAPTFGDSKQDFPDSRPGSPLSMDSNHLSKPRRSLSLTAPTTPTSHYPSSPPTQVQRANSSPAKHRPLSGNSSTFSFNSHTPNPPRAIATTSAPTSSVATALLRASHKEAQKGLANDLLSILERDAKPWGFSYADVKHKVKVWYGDKDEKIGEAGIRWMERIMKDCEVTICKGKDHSLMTNASVVVEALESLQTDLRGSYLFFQDGTLLTDIHCRRSKLFLMHPNNTFSPLLVSSILSLSHIPTDFLGFSPQISSITFRLFVTHCRSCHLLSIICVFFPTFCIVRLPGSWLILSRIFTTVLLWRFKSCSIDCTILRSLGIPCAI
jgi:hypothetical protein